MQQSPLSPQKEGWRPGCIDATTQFKLEGCMP